MEACYARLLHTLIPKIDDLLHSAELEALVIEYAKIIDLYPEASIPHFRLIPTVTDQNPCAQSRSPMDMMRQGCATSLFQASQQ